MNLVDVIFDSLYEASERLVKEKVRSGDEDASVSAIDLTVLIARANTICLDKIKAINEARTPAR